MSVAPARALSAVAAAILLAAAPASAQIDLQPGDVLAVVEPADPLGNGHLVHIHGGDPTVPWTHDVLDTVQALWDVVLTPDLRVVSAAGRQASAGSKQLRIYDRLTGQPTVIPSPAGGDEFGGVTFPVRLVLAPGGSAYVMETYTGDLFEVSLADGASTLLYDALAAGPVAVEPTGSVVFPVAQGAVNQWSLLRLDPGSGQAETILVSDGFSPDDVSIPGAIRVEADGSLTSPFSPFLYVASQVIRRSPVSTTGPVGATPLPIVASSLAVGRTPGELVAWVEGSTDQLVFFEPGGPGTVVSLAAPLPGVADRLLVVPPRPLVLAGDVIVSDGQNGLVAVDRVSGAQALLPLDPGRGPIAEDAGVLYTVDATATAILAQDGAVAPVTVASGGALAGIRSLSATPAGHVLATCAPPDGRVVDVDPATGSQIVAAQAGLVEPVDAAGDVSLLEDVYITDLDGVLWRMPVFGPGTPTAVFTVAPGITLHRIAEEPGGTLLFTERDAGAFRWRVRRHDPATGTTTLLSSHQGVDGGLAVDAAGDVVATGFDAFQPRVLEIDPASGAKTVLSEGGLLQEPGYVAIASAPIDLPACANGRDDDGDGLVDAGADPGCDDAEDPDERSPALVCDDGVDNDGDAGIDYPGDPGCAGPGGPSESPACQNGVDDDGDGGIDFDGGASLNGGEPLGAPDPQCLAASGNREKRQGCGLGFEAALALLAIGRLRRRRSRPRYAGA